MAKSWEQGHRCGGGGGQSGEDVGQRLLLGQAPVLLPQQAISKPEATERPRGRPGSTPSSRNLDPRNLMP